MRQTELVPLLGSRICHDLISPIGAIGNGLELLMMSGIDESPEMALIRDSVASANARIQFFRIAYGNASGGQLISHQELASVVRDYANTCRAEINWQAHGKLSRPIARLLLLLIQCLEHAFPFDGEIKVSHNDCWSVIGTGSKQRHQPQLWAQLQNSSTRKMVEAAEIQFVLAADAAMACDATLKVTSTGDRIEIRF